MRYLLSLFILLFVSNLYSAELDDCWDIQSPIPKEYRSLNTRGTCVWNSLYNCAMTQGIEQLYDVRKDRRCQGGASASDLRRVITSYGVKYKDASGRDACVKLIKEAVAEGRPVIIFFDTNHCVNLVGYDDLANRAEVLNNHHNNRYPLHLTISAFHKRFKNYACVIYGDEEDEARLKEFATRKRLLPQYYFAPGGKKNEKDIN